MDPPKKNVELLDTPGILWPKFEDEAVGMRLAYIGSIKDDILNMEELSLTLIDFLREKYSGALEKRYQIQEEGTAVQILEAIARSRAEVIEQNQRGLCIVQFLSFLQTSSGARDCF